MARMNMSLGAVRRDPKWPELKKPVALSCLPFTLIPTPRRSTRLTPCAVKMVSRSPPISSSTRSPSLTAFGFRCTTPAPTTDRRTPTRAPPRHHCVSQSRFDNRSVTRPPFSLSRAASPSSPALFRLTCSDTVPSRNPRTVGRDKLYRAVQYFARFLAFCERRVPPALHFLVFQLTKVSSPRNRLPPQGLQQRDGREALGSQVDPRHVAQA